MKSLVFFYIKANPVSYTHLDVYKRQSWNRLESGVYVGQEMLSIATRLLTPGSSYRLQVDYDGGQTGILSFTYADEIVLEGYHDRCV